ncbi:MAG TPA: RsmE family RNA methyltransferase [Opitutus sp.]|nr:RsmE family RNA methyltransferase [Opitutus sp.]
MNLILFEPAEIDAPLPRRDPRAVHVLDVLRRKTGDDFDAGIVNGPRGKATVVAIDTDSLTLRFVENFLPAPLDPITLIVGLPRPQTARDILRDATTLGASALHFVITEKGDPNYAASRLWTAGEWRRHVIAGAEQAFDTRIPRVSHGRSLTEALAALPAGGSALALDNYEAPQSLSASRELQLPVALALGPERGWADADRRTLRAHGFMFVHLGSRVLRAESAVVAALTLVRANLNLA